MEAYKRGDYQEYRRLNSQARKYMVFSVALSMIFLLLGLILLLIPGVGSAPKDDVPERIEP